MTRIEEQTGGPARINQISALSVRKSDSCGAGSSTRGEREGGREESVNEFVRNPRRSKHSILFGDYIRGCREKKKKRKVKVKDQGGITGTKIYLNRFRHF